MKQIQKDEGQVLFLDCGGIVPPPGRGQKIVSDLAFKAMNLMNFSAMNMGWTELSLGVDELKNMTSAVSFPMLTSNLVHKDSKLPVGKKYVIKQIGDVKVGIVGIMPTEPPQNMSAAGGCGVRQNSSTDKSSEETPFLLLTEFLEVLSPEEALKNLLPEVKSQSDMVILLSQYDAEATRSIVDKTEGIDVAICASSKRRRTKPDAEQNTASVPMIISAPYWGGLGYLKLTLDENSRTFQKEEKILRLDDAVASDTQIAQIIGNDIDKKIKEEEERRFEEEARALRKLTPYEYYEMIMKQQEKQR